MAYCKKCGAYLPDGLSACLACGYDEAVKTEEAAAAAAAKQSADEEFRRRMEEERKQKQEESRRWAEQEQTRRRQQETARRWAEEESARRRAEQETRQQPFSGNLHRSEGGASSKADGGKLFAALSYLSFLFVLPYIVAPQDEFAKYHAKQGLKLFIFSVIGDALGAITGFGWIFTLLRLYLIYKGMSAALDGREEPLPYIGGIGG